MQVLNIIKRTRLINFIPFYNTTKNAPKQWEVFQKFTDKELFDVPKVNQTLKIKLPKRSPKSQRHLFHGKQAKTGWETSFSEHKNKRIWHVNVTQRKRYYSEILKRNLNVRLSTKAYREMRRLGSFDNYVLLTPPKQLDSFYGEYIRTLMLRKLNNKGFKVPQIVRSKKNKISRFKRRELRRLGNKKTHGIQGVWHPPDQRYIDLSHLRPKYPHQMNKKEYELYEEFSELQKQSKDVPGDHPFIKEMSERLEKERLQLEPERQKALDLLKKIKNQKLVKNMIKYTQEGVKEFKSPPIPKD